MRGSFTKHYMKKYRDSKRQLLITQASRLSISESSSMTIGNSPNNISFRKYLRRNFDGDVPEGQFTKPSTPTWDSVPTPQTPSSGSNTKVRKSRTSYKKINGKIYKLGLCVVLVFVATFLPFPGLVVTPKSQYKCFDNGWFAILLITEFTLFDTVGRYSAGYTKCGLTKER